MNTFNELKPKNSRDLKNQYGNGITTNTLFGMIENGI